MPVEIEIKTLGGLEQIIKRYFPEKIVWFRGQSHKSWGLEPSISRFPRNPNQESLMIKRFKQGAYQTMESAPTEEWQWLFLMQHKAIPTRLLDWSENPLVGLYFAVEKDKDDGVDGALWTLLPTRLNALSGVTYAQVDELPSFDEDRLLDNYLPSKLSLPDIKPPIAAIASRRFARIVAQHGTFTVFHRDYVALNKRPGQDYVRRFIIPKGSKKRLREMLKTFGVDGFAVYPELTNLSERIKNQI